MTFSKKLNVTPEAHDAVRLAAADEGVSQSAWASERLCAAWAAVIAPPEAAPLPDAGVAHYYFDANQPTHKRLCEVAAARSESPAETLAAALDALARPAGIVVPAPPREPQGCRCDGPEEAGPHHRVGCHRRAGLIA